MSENKTQMIRLRIKEIAQEKKISMNKLSRLSDVSLNTVAKIYKDPHYNINSHTLDKIARALGVTPSSLMEQEPDPPTSSQEQE